MGKRILLIGGGGHCKSVLDSIITCGEYDDIGIIDNGSGTGFEGVGVIGNDNDLPMLYKDGWEYAFITVGSVGNTRVRRKLLQLAKDIGFTIPVIVDKTAVIANSSVLGAGTFIGKKAVVNAGSSIGECSIINTGAIVEHDCTIGDFAHISPGAVLCGSVVVGNDSHIGAGTVIRQQIRIGQRVVIGAGSAVVKDIPDDVKAYGVPCKVTDQ